MKPQRSVLGNQVAARGIGAIMGLIVLFAGGVSFTAPAAAQSFWPPPGSCAIEGGLRRFAWLAMEAADANGNGAVTAAEARALFPGLDATQLIFSFTQVYPLDDGYVFWSEIFQMLSGIEGLFDFIRDNIFTLDENLMFFEAPELFAAWDLNGDGVIDCRDVEWFALPQAPDPEYCPLPRDLQRVAEYVWPVFDTDGSGGLSMAELLRIDDALEVAMPLLDTSGDGEASLEEVLALLSKVYYGLDIERSIWEDGPGIVDYEYLKRFMPPNAFDWLDRDDSGIIDCVDLDLPAPGPAPNPDTVPAALPLPETLDPLTNYLWPFLLTPGEHTLSYHEVDMRFAWASDAALIPLADLNRDERISRDELAQFLTATGALPRTSLPRDSNGDRVYTYNELAGWLGDDVLRFIAADANGNGVIDAGDFELLEVPSDATAAAVLLGMMRSGGTSGLAGLSRTVASDMLAHAGLPEFILDTFDADGNGLITAAEVRHLVPESGLHAADTNGNGALGTVELLRVIQFFNMGGLHCAPGPGASEDGYQAGARDARLCMPHTSDYEGEAPDWQISLSELLRVIQFYNARGYHPCDAPESPDGFCVSLTP